MGVTSTPERDEALERIRAIAEAHGLTPGEVAAALRRSADEPPGKAGLLGRILAILGGIFVFSGIAVFIALNWDSMNTAARIIVTLGSGIAAFVLALIADDDQRYQRAATPLFVVAAALQPTGLIVAIDEFFTGGDWHIAALFVSGVMAVQQGLVLYVRGRAVLLFMAILFGLWFFAVALDYVDVEADVISLLLGGCTVGLSIGLGNTRFSEVTPFWFLVGSVSFYVGLFELLDDTVIELAFLAVACGGVFLSASVRSRMMLAISTLAILSYISDYTVEHFTESLGWPLVLILIGIVLIGLSGLALRINRKYIAAG